MSHYLPSRGIFAALLHCPGATDRRRGSLSRRGFTAIKAACAAQIEEPKDVPPSKWGFNFSLNSHGDKLNR